MAADYVEDGISDFSGGQDAYHRPDRILPNQFTKAVNVTTKGGVLSPRPGFWQQELNFMGDPIENDFGRKRTLHDIWTTGVFQAAIPVPDKTTYLITVVNGLIFKTNTQTLTTVLLSKTIKANPYSIRLNWSYAGEWIVIFDFPAYPIYIKGDKVSRADPNFKVNGQDQPQAPVCAIGSYNSNRLIIANAGSDFTAGDPVGSLLTPDAPVTFTEVLEPSAPYFNQFFSLPTDEAIQPITAMGFIQQLDTNVGIGPLFIATRQAIYYFHVEQPRPQWQGAFGALLLHNTGIAGQRAFVNVNSDLLFLNADGKIHSLSTARNEARRWGNISISREVDNYLHAHDPALYQMAALEVFDNRIFVTANPYRVQALDINEQPVTDVAHGGFVVLEIEELASFLQQGTPTWAGLWTGVSPMDVVEVAGRCYVISKDGGGNALYEIRKDERYDMVRKRKRDVRSILYTRQFEFQSDYLMKREHTITTHLQDMEGKIKLKIERKPQHAYSFLEYAEMEYDAIESLETVPEDPFLYGLAPHQIREFVFGDSTEEGCNPVNNDLYNTYQGIQLRITIEGTYWVIQDIKLKARVIPYEEKAGDNTCGGLNVEPVPLQVEPDWLLPEETLCHR